MLTSLRRLVDHAVTEYGIANLKGKSILQRVDVLVSIAHPDLRSELRADARRLYKV
ncbi:acetyl-CoA hydrolase/transferase C-terminal domain-containing protein [Candidatus Binatus sp.]|uniref:acetyl-CoA hydrolase/transferase C-terminal domain-containing protein n=1 Tax=Candidatus Binatus sp. TaxID=2811406 RepID=UPI002F93952A